MNPIDLDREPNAIAFAIKRNALLFGDFTLKSGRKSPVFFNIFHTINDAYGLEYMGRQYVELIMDFLWKILVPMSMNTIGALAVIEFVYIWNQYLWPLIIISSNDNQMIQMGVKRLTSSGPEGMVHWGVSMAGVVITMLPPLLLFILLQEQFMRGFALTEEK